jgi:hypothetical protein
LLCAPFDASAAAPALLSIAVPGAILPSAIHGYVPTASMQSLKMNKNPAQFRYIFILGNHLNIPMILLIINYYHRLQSEPLVFKHRERMK